MPRFRYRAHDAGGRPVEEEVEALSIFDLTQSLKGQGLSVSSVVPLQQPLPRFTGRRRLRWEELRLFTEQLGSIAKSGFPLVPSLASMARDLDQPALRDATDKLREDLERGTSLEAAFRAQEDRFPPIFSAMARAGELTGDLTGVLAMMSAYATRMATVTHRVKMAMAYPLLLSITAISIVMYQLLHIVPVFGDIFGELGAKLPAPTLFLLKVSEILRGHWPTLVALAPVIGLGAVAGYVGMRRNRVGRRWLDTALLFTPGIGVAYHGVVQARFCQTLSLLLGAHVPVLDAVTLAGGASGSATLEHRMNGVAEEIAYGAQLSDALRKTSFFAPSFHWLLGAAEERGQVVEALDNLSESAERNVRAREQMLGSVITPALVVVIGGIVGFIAVSMYLPIFTLGDQLGAK
ncbi:MAG: type II secretion system F family protein [Candidatus Hydrogenedentes bacterium]|nr:type II secretion system F family protein [Candidatus Hydrogenedentota bacterium]